MEQSWDEFVDVLVMGSGSAGLTAGLAARHAGAEVLVAESTDKFGGTSAMSGGIAWIPNNHHMHEVGSTDTREDALAYLRAFSLGATDDALMQSFVDAAPEAIRFLESASPLKFHALRMPDYHHEFPGGNHGRSIIAEIVSGQDLGDLRPMLRPAPNFPIPITPLDLEQMGAVASFTGDGDSFLESDAMVERIQNDMLGCGAGLVAGLLKASLDAGVRLSANTRVRRLILSDGVIVGVEAERDGAIVHIRVHRGVVIASGGFERNDALLRDFMRGPLQAAIGSPGCVGDGLLMAMEVGAAVTNMSEAWWVPVLRIPGEEYEGRDFYRPTTIERAMPGLIMVNRKGQRFANEAINYNDLTRAFHSFDPVAFEFANLPAWLILHKGRLDRHAFLTRFPSDPVPNWLIAAPTIRELAVKIGIDPDSLQHTVDRFNAHAEQGIDPDFDRGGTQYDVYFGDPERDGRFGTLGPLDEPPFYAIQVFAGSIGTKGGPKTTPRAEVLNVRGEVIPGLYAAGNAMGSFMGMGYPGAGGTIGPAITFGYLAGRGAAGANRT